MKSVIFAIVSLLIWAGVPLAENRKPLASVPFELIGEKIFMKARVNGSEEINLQFDTGAGSTVIDEGTAAKLGLAATGETTNEGAAGSAPVPTSAGHTVDLGGVNFPSITFLHLPLGDYEGVKRDGVIGFDMLKGYVVKIDYDTKTIAFHDARSFRYSGKGKTVGFRLWSNSALMDIDLVLLSGRKIRGKVMVDNGADLPLLVNAPFVARHDLMQKVGKVAKGSISGSDGSEVATYRGKTRAVTIGGFAFQDFPVRLTEARAGTLSLNDLDGILGNPILKKFNITFDYRRRKMYWEPNGSFAESVR